MRKKTLVKRLLESKKQLEYLQDSNRKYEMDNRELTEQNLRLINESRNYRDKYFKSEVRLEDIKEDIYNMQELVNPLQALLKEMFTGEENLDSAILRILRS